MSGRTLPSLTQRGLYISPHVLAASTTQIFLVVAPDGRIRMANEAAAAAYGHSAAELNSLNYSALCTEDELMVANQLDGAYYGGGTCFEAMHRRKDGETFLVEASAIPVQVDGQPAVLLSMTDITTRRRAQAVQLLLREFDQRVLQQQPLTAVLKNLCDGLAASFGYPLVWVAGRRADGTVSALAHSGDAPWGFGADGLRWDEPNSAGAAGMAIRTGRTQLMGLERLRLTPWRSQAEAKGWHAAIGLPLITPEGTTGALSLIAGRDHRFDSETVSLLTDFADQIAISLVGARHQERIRLQTAALESAGSAVLITDHAGSIQWINPAFTCLTGYTADEALGRTPRILKSGCQDPEFYEALWRTILTGKTWRGEFRNRHKDGTLRMHEATITPVRGTGEQVTHFVSVMQDVTTRHRLEDQLRHMAMHDPLTELPNRRLLMDGLQRLVRKAKRGYIAAMLLLDVDGFGRVNEAAGRAIGDRFLSQIGTRLRELFRPYDLLARLSADEFAVLLEDETPAGALATAERVRKALAQAPFDLNGRTVHITVSFGVVAVDGTLTPSGVLARADAALLAAKQAGNMSVFGT